MQNIKNYWFDLQDQSLKLNNYYIYNYKYVFKILFEKSQLINLIFD